MNKEVNYLKEHLYEIYQYKKSMKDLTYDMDLEHLLRTCKTLDYLQKENEKYREVLDKIKETLRNTPYKEDDCDYINLQYKLYILLEEIE